VATVLGLAGAGDLYVTCQHGRNGRFGRLLGSGATVEGAIHSIGSTVEGVANTAAALRLAARTHLDLPTARAVDLALTQDLTGGRVSDQLRDLFLTVVSGSRPPGDRPRRHWPASGRGRPGGVVPAELLRTQPCPARPGAASALSGLRGPVGGCAGLGGWGGGV